MTDTQAVIFRQSRFAFLTSWLLPTSFNQARESEREILKFGGIEVPAEFEFQEHGKQLDKSADTHLLHVDIGNNEYINTLKLDANGFDSDSSGKLNVVLCHGFGAGLGFFYKNFRSLMQIPNSRIYAIDWLGMGMSSRPVFEHWKPHNSDEAIDFFMNSFDRWREKQPGLEKFVLVGHSLGGYLAALYALKNPERVSKLILVSPVGIPECVDEKISVVGRPFPSWITRVWNGSYTPQWIIRTLGPMGPRFVRGYTTARFPYLAESESTAFSNYLYHISAAPGSSEYSLSSILAPGAWARKPLFQQLSELKMPTSFLYGEVDWMDYRNAEDASKHMKVETKIIRIPEAGHHLYMDNPVHFNSALVQEILSSNK